MRAGMAWRLTQVLAVGGSACLMALACAGESDGRGVHDPDRDDVAAVTVEVIDTIRPSRAEHQIALPSSIYQVGGSWVIGDLAERNIKIVDTLTGSMRLVSRAGSGPGEFSSLRSVGVSYDSIVGLEGAGTPEVRLLSDSGQFMRAFPAVVWEGSGGPSMMRVVDDSLILIARNPFMTTGKPLAFLLDRTGAVRSAFYHLDNYLAPEAFALMQYTVPFGDGRDGVVWLTVSGADSVTAFDYAGETLGSVAVRPSTGPLTSYKEVFEANGGAAQRPDGSWVTDSLPTIMSLVALPGRRALVQVMRVDAIRGTDLLVDAGELVLLQLRSDGRIASRPLAEVHAGLLGRDRAGRALLLHLTDDGGAVEVSRVSW